MNDSTMSETFLCALRTRRKNVRPMLDELAEKLGRSGKPMAKSKVIRMAIENLYKQIVTGELVLYEPDA